MSAVLCLPACLCVSTAASSGQAPHGNASVGSPPLTFKECITKYPKGCFVCYGRIQAHDHDQKTCKWYAEDKAAFARANPDRKLKSEPQRPQGIREVQAELQKLVGLDESLEKMLTSEKSPKERMPQAASPSTAAH